MPAEQEKSAKKKQRARSESNSKPVATHEFPANAPDGWLKQIKEAVRESKKGTIVLTIAGSSVLASVLTTGGTFLLQPQKARLDYEAKLSDARLLDKQNQLNKRREAYEKADQELKELSTVLRTYVATCLQGSHGMTSAEMLKFAEESWDQLTNKLNDVRNAESSNQDMNPEDSETTTDMQDIAGQLGVNLFSENVVKLKAQNPELVRSHQEFQDRIARLRKSIKQKRAALTL